MKYCDAVPITDEQSFYPWQPSTWPAPPLEYNQEFGSMLRKIFHESLLFEIENVINDAPTMEHRGHVVALSILCAIDAVSSYAFQRSNSVRCLTCGRTDKVGPRYKKYIQEFFPKEYQKFSDRIYHLYRNSITHSWNLFEATMLPGDQPIVELNGTIVLGLRHFFSAFKESVNTFLVKLAEDSTIQASALKRYSDLKRTAR
ncbi:MAG: hypothetical protein HZC52_12310 [Planctomycetes bacterium]|nr:hypothetical protein [Planctomycetota bacterium]